jgi:hypothetical protein
LALIGPSTVACWIGSGLQALDTLRKFKPWALRQFHTAGDRPTNGSGFGEKKASRLA